MQRRHEGCHSGGEIRFTLNEAGQAVAYCTECSDRWLVFFVPERAFGERTRPQDPGQLDLPMDVEFVHEGLRQDRIRQNGGELEYAFAEGWKKENRRVRGLNGGRGILENLLLEPPPVGRESIFHVRRLAFPLTQNICTAAAVVVQWLGTNCGFCFLSNCLKADGWELTRVKGWPPVDPWRCPMCEKHEPSRVAYDHPTAEGTRRPIRYHHNRPDNPPCPWQLISWRRVKSTEWQADIPGHTLAIRRRTYYGDYCLLVDGEHWQPVSPSKDRGSLARQAHRVVAQLLREEKRSAPPAPAVPQERPAPPKGRKG